MTFARDDLRVLVVAPIGRDGPALAAVLGAQGIGAEICADLGDCSSRLTHGAGALLITEEGLAAGNAGVLIAALDRQPAWSALPVIVVASGDAAERLEVLGQLGLTSGAVSLLERPVRRASLISAVQVALSTRRRQYEVRDLLEERRRRERQLRNQAAELRASEFRFRQMADAAPAMLWVTDQSGTCTFLSRGWYEYTGQTEEAGPSRGWRDPVHADDLRRAERVFGEAARAHRSFQIEYRLRTVEGGHRWVVDAGRPWFGAEGHFLGYIGSVIDIHELRMAERDKDRSHALLDAVLESLPVGVLIADAKGTLLRWNKAHEALWGLVDTDSADTPSIDDQRWRGWWADTGEPISAEQWSLSRALLHGEVTSGALVEIERFDGEGRRTSMNASAPVRDRDGNIIAAVVAQVDVTDVLRMERELQESEEKFRTLADNIPPFAWMADETGWIFWFNRRWFDYTGTTLEEMEGWGWRRAHHPDHVDRVVEKIRRCFETGEVWEDIFPLRGKDGEYRWFLSRAVPLYDESGRITRWLGTNTDVTEQRLAEEALRDADRRKDEFLATLAHELRNPLAPIRTCVELLRLQGGDAQTLELCRDIVDRQVRDLTRLVDDLLEVSRITRGKVQLRLETVTLKEAVERAVEAARPLVDAAGHHLRVELPGTPLWLTADSTRLTQVFTNLLNNAASYTPAGGHISLVAAVEGDHVTVSVRDNGIGISAEHLPRIFEMFSQARPVLERPNAGLGIGLSLAKGLVELHHGNICAMSEGEGRGSTFTITLPLAEAPGDATATDASDDTPGSSLKILVVDDNRDAADGLARMLELMGHRPLVAYDGPDALEAAEHEAPDVVLLDIGLPSMNGYEVARQIRRRPWGRGVMLVAQTGWGKEQDKRRAADAGFDHHLVKPLSVRDLTAVLGTV